MLDDMKDAMNAAAAMSADDVVVLPAQRIDTRVSGLEGEPLQRTDYAGTAWYGGRPQLSGRHPIPGANAAQIRAPFWLPDSHRYRSSDEVLIQMTAAVQGGMATSAGGNLQILEASAALSEDPQQPGELLAFATVDAVATLPFGVSYRVTVVCPPAVVEQA